MQPRYSSRCIASAIAVITSSATSNRAGRTSRSTPRPRARSGGRPGDMTLAAHQLLSLAALAACGGAQPAAVASETTLDGKPITTLATAQGYPINIAGDGSGVFWTNHLGGQVVALAGSGAPRVVAEQQDYPLGDRKSTRLNS